MRKSIVPLAPLALGAALLSGCFGYERVELQTAPVGREYRVLITRSRMEALRDLDEQGLPESGPPLLRGTLVARQEQSVSLRVPLAARQVGFHQAEIDRQLTLPVTDIVESEARVISKPRTGLAIVGAAALTAGVIVAILNGAHQWDQNPDPPLPDALRGEPGGGVGIPLPILAFLRGIPRRN